MAHGFDESEMNIPSNGVEISGTLTMPAHAHGAVPLVILIAGSGPTDRDCNQQGMKSDAFKKLAHALVINGIAVFRYDKQGVGKSTIKNFDESMLRFDDMVADASAVRASFAQDKRFSSITFAGHSEGSLVGMKATPQGSKYISIAGPADDASTILKTQLKGRLGSLEDRTFKQLDSLVAGQMVTCNMPALMALFRPSVQPYLISWFKYKPTNEIKKLDAPVLIINGTADLQVAVAEAEKLHQAKQGSTLLLIDKMNHVLTELSDLDQKRNSESYGKPRLPVSKKLVDAITFCFEVIRE
ncbi:MAG: alpha/beta hydrolase [Bacteroidota bacterium]|nr:MAG: alpha/beta hydrolase [Bacteroidota bacterium]